LNQVYAFQLNTQAKKNILLLDTFHFSAWNKSEEKDIYLPIVKAVKKYSK